MNPLSSDPLSQAEQAIHDGKINEARVMLIDYIKRDPNYDRAWWLLTFTLTDVGKQVDCLKRVLHLNPGHAQAREWLAKLKKTGSLPPLKQAVNPFLAGETEFPPAEPLPSPVFSSRAIEPPVSAPVPVWPTPEGRHSAPSLESILFPNGQTFNAVPPSGTNPPVWTLPEDEKPEPPAPGQPVQGLPPEGKKPRKKNTWIVDVVIISIILCVAITAGAIYWVRQTGFEALSALQTPGPTSAQTDKPTITLEPSWTRTFTRTPTATETLTETPTLTPTLEFTLTPSPIPESMIGPVVSLYPPDFTLIDAMTGEQVTLSDYRGQPVLLLFFATWCPYCKAEMPSLEAVYQEYKDDGLVVLAIDSGEAASTVSNFGITYDLTFPLLLDEDQAVNNLYNVDTLPRHFFIGRNGRISLIEYGAMSSGQLDFQAKTLVKIYSTPTP